MGNLTEQQASLPVKLTGANSSGVEDNYVDADINGNLKVIDYATAATGASVPVDASYSAGRNPSGNLQGIAVDATGQQKVNLNDGVGNNVTSTTLNSKQRLDVNTASEGVDGTTSPFSSVSVAGKDANGNLQTVLTDTTGAIVTTDRIALTAESPSAISVGVASGVVIAANTSRRGLVLTNTSTGIISFNISGGTAVLRSGITLYPGGHWEMDSYTFTTAAINGIASVAASNLAIQELT